MNSKVYIVGSGIGSVELMTIKAFKILQKAEVVLFDRLVSKEIIEIIPNQCLKIFVGKNSSGESQKQDEINELLLRYSKMNLCVVRLKGGDPFVFGRGSEEVLYLKKHGVECEVIPGVSSAIAAPMAAGIAVTHRGIANSFSVVSSIGEDSKLTLEWIDLLKIKNHTVVALMSLGVTKQIIKTALSYGINSNHPVAIVSHAMRESQNVQLGTLSTLENISKDVSSPAIIVFGDVVKLSNILPHFEVYSANKAVNF